MSRKVILDTETTGLYTKDGHRLIEMTAIEMVKGVATGRELHILVNPERDIPPETTKIHGITNEMVADKPIFAEFAKEVREFIGNSPIIITCRTDSDGYTLDIAMLNMEMEKAGLPPFKEEQWVNVRRWSEAMFGNDEASLDKILDRYGIDRSERDKNGHGATLDARLLSDVYLKLLEDYTKFTQKAQTVKPESKTTPPSI